MAETSTSQPTSAGTAADWGSTEPLVLSDLFKSCFAEFFDGEELGGVVPEASFVDDSIRALADHFDEMILIEDTCPVL